MGPDLRAKLKAELRERAKQNEEDLARIREKNRRLMVERIKKRLGED